MANLNAENNEPKKVLVVDDHILFREGFISLFQSSPEFTIVGEAGTVHEGIQKAKLLRPDIVIMDFSLPDGTGLDATKAIISVIPDCKIIFLTGHEEDEKLFAAIRAGAKGYISKNAASSDLISSLSALERGEMAISRKMACRVMEEFSTTKQKDDTYEEIYSKLSPRELDVLCELQTGDTNCEIAERLFISENTVKRHVSSILTKLDLKNRREASLIARQVRLIENRSTGQHQGP